MIRSACYLLVAGALASLGGFSPVTGANPSAASGRAEPSPEANGQKAVGQALTNESIGEMLTAMGYEYTTTKLESGDLDYALVIPRDDWTFRLYISLSKNRKFVWLDAPLHFLPPEGQVEGEPLVRLMTETWAVGPNVFSVWKAKRRLYLQRSIENQYVTPSKLRDAIDGLTSTVRTTAPLWDIPALGKPAKAGDAAALGVSQQTGGVKAVAHATPRPVPGGLLDRVTKTEAQRATEGADAPGKANGADAAIDDPTLTMINHTASRVTFKVDDVRRCVLEGGKSCTITIKAGPRRIDTYDVNGNFVKSKTFTAEKGQVYTYSVWYEP